jgi:hypothetical protein
VFFTPPRHSKGHRTRAAPALPRVYPTSPHRPRGGPTAAAWWPAGWNAPLASAGVKHEHAGRQDKPVHGKGQEPGGEACLAVGGDEFVGMPVGNDSGNRGNRGHGQGGGDPDQRVCDASLRRAGRRECLGRYCVRLSWETPLPPWCREPVLGATVFRLAQTVPDGVRALMQAGGSPFCRRRLKNSSVVDTLANRRLA